MIPLPDADIMMADGKPRASGDDPLPASQNAQDER